MGDRLIAISTIIVTYQSRAHIAACLESIKVFAPGDVEVIVVDNASTDGTCEVVRTQMPAATLVALPENRGFATGVNRGVSLASGRALLLLNPDARLTAGALEALLTHIESSPFVAATGPQFTSPDGQFQASAFTYPSLAMTWLEFFPWPGRLVHGPLNGRLIPDGNEPIVVDHPLGACMLIQRSAWRDVGPLDEGFFLYCEEVDWCMRAKRRGWVVTSVPGARVIHEGGASAASAPAESIVHLYESRHRLHRKHRGPAFRAVETLITRVGLAHERRRLLKQHGNPYAAALADGIERFLKPRPPFGGP